MSSKIDSFDLHSEHQIHPSFYDRNKLVAPKGKVFIPLMGSKLACGLFGIHDDFIENYQSLDERFIKNKTSSFLFEAIGDSMEPSIFKGDLLLVDRSIEYYHRKICVLSYEGSLICKRVFKIPEGIILHSDNTKYKQLIITDNSLVEIWGVVTSRHGSPL